MSDLGQWLFERERATIDKMISQRAGHKLAYITSFDVVNGLVTVDDPLSGQPETQKLKVMGNIPQTIGAPVIIHPLAGGDRVASRLHGWNAGRGLVMNGAELDIEDTWLPASSMAGGALTARAVNLRWTHTLGAQSAITLTANRQYHMPFFAPDNFTSDNFLVEVMTFVAGDIMLAVYPGNSLAQPSSGILATTAKTTVTSTGLKTIPLTSTFTAEPGKWYMLSVAATSAMAIRGVSGVTMPALRSGGNQSNLAEVFAIGYRALTAGWTTLLDPPGATTALANTFLDIALRVDGT